MQGAVPRRDRQPFDDARIHRILARRCARQHVAEHPHRQRRARRQTARVDELDAADVDALTLEHRRHPRARRGRIAVHAVERRSLTGEGLNHRVVRILQGEPEQVEHRRRRHRPELLPRHRRRHVLAVRRRDTALAEFLDECLRGVLRRVGDGRGAVVGALGGERQRRDARRETVVEQRVLPPLRLVRPGRVRGVRVDGDLRDALLLERRRALRREVAEAGATGDLRRIARPLGEGHVTAGDELDGAALERRPRRQPLVEVEFAMGDREGTRELRHRRRRRRLARIVFVENGSRRRIAYRHRRRRTEPRVLQRRLDRLLHLVRARRGPDARRRQRRRRGLLQRLIRLALDRHGLGGVRRRERQDAGHHVVRIERAVPRERRHERTADGPRPLLHRGTTLIASCCRAIARR